MTAGHRIARSAIALAVAVYVAMAGPVSAARPDRLMPFLCRDAVVRESSERVALIGAGAEPPCSIVVGTAASGPRQTFEQQEIARAATTMRQYLQKITGVECPVLRSAAEAGAASGPRILVGGDGAPVAGFPELKQVDYHGFLIATRPGPESTDLHLISPSGTGTRYAVWFFLMNYADLRIVAPGEIGEVYPRLERLEVPQELYVLNPAPDFLLRIWSGQGGFDQTALLADHGGTQRFEYHHNMKRIYDPKRFGATHPEFYPIKQGKPAIPAPDQGSAWQPTFSHPAVAQRAIEYADELFTERPDMKSMSLSVNDGLGYSEADILQGELLPDGSISISAIYYRYVNTVARGIARRWPGKYVAFFPYNLVKAPPDFALEDNVMIFLLNEPKTTYKAWRGKVKSIGIYQWLYGIGWVIPNHWPHAMQHYLRWVRAHGGNAFKGEAYVAWAQAGPKMWVLNNLLWNVDADVDALLGDFYEHAHGREAAPAMARFFGQAEKIYERRRTRDEYKIAKWHPGGYQFEHATPRDFEIMSQALEDANRLVRGEANATRVDMVTRCYTWGRYYWDQYHAIERLRTARVRSQADVDATFRAALDFYELPAGRDAYYKESIEPLAQYCVFARAPDQVDWSRADPQFTWSGWDEAVDTGFGAVTAFKGRTQDAEQVETFWQEVASRHPLLKPFADSQRLFLLHAGQPLKNLLTNPSFEEPPGPPQPTDRWKYVAQDWGIYHNRMVNAEVSLDPDVKRTGARSLTAKGLTDYSGVIRPLRVANRARYRLSFWYRTTEDVRHAFYGLMMKPRIREHIDPAQEWTKVERVFTVNYPTGDTAGFTLMLCLRHGGSEKSQVWFDDVRLEMLAPEGIEGG